jgi:hypothetical protein
MKNSNKNMSFVVKLQRPVCRTPIKPLQVHKKSVGYKRKLKHPLKEDKLC